MAQQEQDQRASETERRRITVMFADITGFTSLVEKSDNEEAYEVVTGCLQLLDGIARKYGGSVDKYLGDCIMAVFGLPLAIEDAPRAAVNAAIEMLRRIHDYNEQRGLQSPLGVHIGINSGLAISGDVSGPVLREFAVMGDPVNISSRLKDLAPTGEVYVGEETWRGTRDAFAYDVLAPIRLKGKEREVQPYRLRSTRELLHQPRGVASGSIFSDLVGRDEVMESLRAGLAGLSEGRGSLQVLIGEAGIGKTRILDEISRVEEASDLEWLRGSGLAIGQNLAYHVFAGLLRTRLEIRDDEDDDTAREKLKQALAVLVPNEAAETMAIVGSLIGLRLGAEERRQLRRLEGDAMEHVILLTITELLTSLASRRPVVLVLDDLHWADASSLRLLERLLRLARELPILFLLGAREGYSETSGRLLEAIDADHAERTTRYDLKPLTHEAARRLLSNLVHHGSVPTEFLSVIEERTRGNPFFMEEVVRSLVETGVLQEDERGLSLAVRAEQVEIPNSVHDVVMTRIDRLPVEARGILQGASVVGRSVHAAVLRAVLPEEEQLEEKVATLVEAGMLIRESGGRRFEFKHPLIREIAYESILRRTREELHLRVAQAVEDELNESVPGFHAMLSYHYALGRDAKSAEEYLFKAGKEATKLAAADEALRLFHEAAGLYFDLHPDGGDPAKRAELERNIARAHANRGELTETIEHINRALDALGESVPSSAARRALKAAPGLWATLRMLYLRRAPARRSASDHERKVIELMMERARAQTTTAPAPSFVFDSFDTFRKIVAVDPSSIPGAGGMLAGMVGPIAWGGVSLGLSKRFLDLAEPYVDVENLAECFFFETMRLVHYQLTGEWRAEHEIPRERVDAALRIGLLWEVTNYLFLEGERQVTRGHFDTAATSVIELQKICDLYHYDLSCSSRRYLRLVLELERGRHRVARDAANEYFTEHQEKPLKLLALGHRAKAELLAGDREQALATLEESRSLLDAERLVPPFYQLPHWRSCLLADVLAMRDADGKPDGELAKRARKNAKKALSAVRMVAVRGPEVLRLEAERLYRIGKKREAWARAAESLDAAEGLGAAPDQARTHAMLSRWLSESGEASEIAGKDAAGHRAAAIELRSLIGAFGWNDALAPNGDPLDAIELPVEL